MIEFGQKLKKKRESKNISLEEISINTNISINYLRAIESGDMSQLPESFMKLFMKSYAKEIGVKLHTDKKLTKVNAVRHQSSLFGNIDEIYPNSDKYLPKGKKKKDVTKHKDVFKSEKEEDSNKASILQTESSIFSASFDEDDMNKLSIFMDKDDKKPSLEEFISENKIGVFTFIGIFIIIVISITSYLVFHEEEEISVETPLINVITVSDNEGGISVNMRDSVYFDEAESKEERNKLYADSMYFNMMSQDTCYIIHYKDNEKIFENILYPGSNLLIKGSSLIEMKVGKIEALTFEYNGKVFEDNMLRDKKGTAYLKISRLFGPEVINRSKKIVDYLKETYGKK